MPDNPILQNKNPWTGSNFERLAEPVRQSKSFEVLQAARNRLQNMTASSSIFGNEGGSLSSLSEKILPSSSTNNFETASPIDLKFEINIQGNANADDVQNGIVQTIPMIESTLERRLAELRHENQRRSFV